MADWQVGLPRLAYVKTAGGEVAWWRIDGANGESTVLVASTDRTPFAATALDTYRALTSETMPEALRAFENVPVATHVHVAGAEPASHLPTASPKGETVDFLSICGAIGNLCPCSPGWFQNYNADVQAMCTGNLSGTDIQGAKRYFCDFNQGLGYSAWATNIALDDGYVCPEYVASDTAVSMWRDDAGLQGYFPLVSGQVFHWRAYDFCAPWAIGCQTSHTFSMQVDGNKTVNASGLPVTVQVAMDFI